MLGTAQVTSSSWILLLWEWASEKGEPGAEVPSGEGADRGGAGPESGWRVADHAADRVVGWCKQPGAPDQPASPPTSGKGRAGASHGKQLQCPRTPETL